MRHIRLLITECQRRERAQIVAVVEACRCGDLEQLVEALDVAEKAYDGWKRVFRALAKVEITSEEMRAGWLRIWLRDGDLIRQEVGDDLILIRALRVLLPRYRGPAMTLFRGDSAYNRKRRTYGPSWSAEREIAEAFACGHWQTIEGGSVLLSTVAPPQAIMCVVSPDEDRYGET